MDTAVHVKRESSRTPGALAYEVAGLEWLREAQACRVVPVIDVTATTIVETALTPTMPNPRAAREFGKELAALHAAGASAWGSPPPNYHGPAWMGLAPLELPGVEGSWGQFYSRYRIEPYLTGALAADPQIRELRELLESGQLDHPQPALVSDYARTHGDLWSGNLMWTSSGVTLIDPAAQGGHAEEDLAAMALFGTPYLDDIIAAYDRASPLARGWQSRVGLHQMHMLVVHAYLFGGGYERQCVEVAAQVLASAS